MFIASKFTCIPLRQERHVTECLEAHGAPLERTVISGLGYKHGAPPEHFAAEDISQNHFSGKALNSVILLNLQSKDRL